MALWGGSPSNTMWPGRRPILYLHTKWDLGPSSRLATTDVGRNLGVCCAPFRGAGSPCNTMWAVTWAEAYPLPSGILIHPAVWPQYMGQNLGGMLCPASFFGWGAELGPPSNTVWPGPRPTTMPSFSLIHPTVWPQYTNVTGRTDRQTGQQSDSIGQTFYKW